MSRSVRLPSPALVVALVALFVALSGGAAAGTALVSRQGSSNASASAPASLVRRVTALEKEVKALQKQSNLTQGAVGFLTVWSACDAATTADALQGTWQTIDQLSVATQAGKTYFGPQVQVDDTFAGRDACSIARVGRTFPVLVPPSIGYFNNLLRVFR